MTTDRLLEIVAGRGLRILLVGEQLTLRGPKDQQTPGLLKALKLPTHREAILGRLRADPKATVAFGEPEPMQQPRPEPAEEPTPEPLTEEVSAEDEECVFPWQFQYLWGTGHWRVYPAGRPTPGAAWWCRACGSSDAKWIPLPDCPEHLRDKPPERIEG